MSSGSDSDSNPRPDRKVEMCSGSESSGEGYWRVSSEEEGGDRDIADLGSNATSIKSFTVTNQSSQIVQRVGNGEFALEPIQLPTGALVPSSGLELANRSGEFPTGQASVIQYNVSQTYNVQQFGDVTVEGARNLNIGGTQNISSKSGPSQEEEEKPLTTTQKIRRRTESKIQAWTRGMVKTQGLVRVLDKIHKGVTWVTIKGSPGEGKTTVAYMALEELYTEGRQVFQVISPEEFSEVIMTSSRPVIMLDDVFGDLEFDETEWVRWKSALKLVLALKEHRSDELEVVQSTNKGATVILVGRDYVINSAAGHMGRLSDFVKLDHYVVDMSHSVERGLQEKIDIWNARVKTKGIELPENVIFQICESKSPHGFPHVCRLFVEIYRKDNDISAKDFFKSPIEFLNQTIVAFMKNTHKLTLFEELVKGDGKVRVRELQHFKHRAEIIQAANDLVGPYLRKEADYFVFDHPSIYDCVAFNMCQLDPQFVIKNCKLSFIYHRLRIERQRDTDIPGTHSNLAVYLSQSYTDDLAERFAAEIENGNYFYVLSHETCSEECFIKTLMSKIKIPFSKLFTSPDKKTGDYFLSLIASNKSSHLLEYIHMAKGELNTREIQAILFGACRFAATDILSYLVNCFDDLDINVQTDVKGQTPLMVAAESADSGFVHEIMSLNPDVNAQDSENKNVFHYLCENGHVSHVEQLIVTGTDINVNDGKGRSPLWFACLGNQVDVVNLLLDRGVTVDAELIHLVCRVGSMDVGKVLFDNAATIDIVLSDGQTPLHIACKFGNVQMVSFLAQKDCVDVNVLNRYGDTPLHTTSVYNTNECADVLLKAGADVNVQHGPSGYTPLHEASQSVSTECVDTLLRASAGVNAKNIHGYTPLHLAARQGSKECVERLLKAGADVNIQSIGCHTPLYGAAMKGSKECVVLLLKAGANVNVVSNDGQTMLHTATKSRSKECVDMLLKAGADVNVQSQDGSTPLHGAAMVGSKECVDLLLKAGAIVNVQSKDGETSLHKAAWRGSKVCVNMLLKAGADVNMQTVDGYTALHKAAGMGCQERIDLLFKAWANVNVRTKDGKPHLNVSSPDCVALLLKVGADVNVKSKDGNTSLHVSAKSGSEECVNMLLKAGADVNVQLKDGSTPLHQAAMVGAKACVDMMLKAGADMNIQDKAGHTPLHTAQEVGSDECIYILMKAVSEVNIQD